MTEYYHHGLFATLFSFLMIIFPSASTPYYSLLLPTPTTITVTSTLNIHNFHRLANMVLKNIHPGPVQDTFPTDLTAGLPPDHARTTFRRLLNLERELSEVSSTLRWNNSEGNQYLLVKDIDIDTRHKLAEEKLLWDWRVLFKGDDALIRVRSYDAVRVDKLVGLIIEKCASGLGIQEVEMDWASGSGRPTWDSMDYYRHSWRNWWKYNWREREMVVWTLTSTGEAEGKMPDDCFFPLEKHGRDGNWPTLVVESGVFESLDRLREDAKWWFSRSYGDVRIVLVVVADKPGALLRVEKWQLMPREVGLGGLKPEMGQQTVDIQRPVMAQSVTVSPDAVVEGESQIVLDFRAMFNRAPRGKETDVEIDATALMELVP